MGYYAAIKNDAYKELVKKWKNVMIDLPWAGASTPFCEAGGCPSTLNHVSPGYSTVLYFVGFCQNRIVFSVLEEWSLTFCSLLADEEMMATEVTPSAMAELTDLGKCLMKHEVGGGGR